MSLLHPWFLLLALLVPVALVLGRRAPAVLFAPGAGGLPRSRRAWLLLVPQLFQVAGLLLVVLCVARPVRRVPVPHTREGIDIMLCLDTSSSMRTDDMLGVAKDAAARFIAGRPDDRIGLVCFARYPDVRCPPTRDHGALQEFLSGVTLVADDGPEDATGIGTAVARAAHVLRGGVVILLTDGEENVATERKPDEIAPLHAGQLSRRLGVRVYAIAAGGDNVETGQIRGLAERTGGKFFSARDAGAMASVYDEINRLERVEFDEPRYRIEERFLPVLLAAVVLLLAGRFLKMAVLP